MKKTIQLGLTAVLMLSALSMAAQSDGSAGSNAAPMAKPFFLGPKQVTVPVTIAAVVPLAVPVAEPRLAAAAEPPAADAPQVKDDLFDGTEKFNAGASQATELNMGPDMLDIVSGKHGGDVAHKLNFMVVRTYTYPREGMYKMEDVDIYRQKLKTGNWNCFIHTYEQKSGESTDICKRALPNDAGNEMVILTVQPKQLTFIHMSGHGSLADLGNLDMLGKMGKIKIEPPKEKASPSPSPNPAPQ
jgi:hypothetical protein